MSGVYEQIKDDLGYLQLDRAVEVFATLAETGPHRRPVARRVPRPARRRTGHRDTQPAARRPAALRPVPVPQDDRRVRLRVPADRRPQPRRRPRHACGSWTDGRPILFLGQPGCGKTHLAVAIATLAVEAGYRGYFTNAEEMVANIAQAAREGTLASKLKTYTAPSVLVIDDVGLLPMERGAASAFYQVINQRYEKQHSTIVTTNRSLPDWGEIFGDTVVASAILDRLMHNAVVFNIKGPSWRLREHHALTTATTDPTKRRPS